MFTRSTIKRITIQLLLVPLVVLVFANLDLEVGAQNWGPAPWLNVKTEFGCVGNATTNDADCIQRAINAATNFSTSGNHGATVYSPPGRYLINASSNHGIIMPRGGLSALTGNIIVRGAGKDVTDWHAGSGYTSGHATVEWDQSSAIRTYNQEFEDMTITAPAVDGTYAMHYQMVGSKSSDANIQDEWISHFNLHNMGFNGANQFNPAMVYIESGWRFSDVSIIRCNPTFANGFYSTTCILTDSVVNSSAKDLDVSGFEFSTMSNIASNWISGGYSTLFNGRMLGSRFSGGFGNGGYTTSTKSVSLTNSYGNTLDTIRMEGYSDKQWYLDHSDGNIFINIGVGTVDGKFGGVDDIRISAGGSGCTTGTFNFVFAGVGSGATATGTFSGGALVSTNVTAPGSGYQGLTIFSGTPTTVTIPDAGCSTQPTTLVDVGGSNGITLVNSKNNTFTTLYNSDQTNGKFSSRSVLLVTLDGSSTGNRFRDFMVAGPLSTEVSGFDGTDNYIEAINTLDSHKWNTAGNNGIFATVTIDFASVADGACSADSTVTLSYSVANEQLLVKPPVEPVAGIFFYAFGIGSNQAKVRMCNMSGGAVDLASGSYLLKAVR